MSTAKQLIIDNLSDISDGIQDEFEVMENLYKLLRFKKSQQSITEYGAGKSGTNGRSTTRERTKYAKCFKRNVKKGQFLHEHNLV